MKKSKRAALLASAAFAGVVIGITGCSKSEAPPAANNTPTPPKEAVKAVEDAAGTAVKAAESLKHDCAGKNECAGKGGCHASDNGCKGKNSCKGKGGCKAS